MNFPLKLLTLILNQGAPKFQYGAHMCIFHHPFDTFSEEFTLVTGCLMATTPGVPFSPSIPVGKDRVSFFTGMNLEMQTIFARLLDTP